MFGLVRPLECELKVREQAVYRAYYCGVCRTIGAECGQLARTVLQYDCAFLALFLAACTADIPAYERRFCPVHPCRGKQASVTAHPAVAYAANANVILAYYKLLDDRRDEHSGRALAASCLLRAALSRAAAREPALAASIRNDLERLSAVERSWPDCTDVPADAFGCLLRNTVLLYPGMAEKNRKPAGWLFYNLGRWIYLADAWADRERDAAAGRYNAFQAAGLGEDDAGFLLNMSLYEAVKALDLLELQAHGAILDNILRLGCVAHTRTLLKGAAHESV